MAAGVVSCVSLVPTTNLLDVLPVFFLHHTCRGSTHDHRLRLLLTTRVFITVFYDYFKNMSPTSRQCRKPLGSTAVAFAASAYSTVPIYNPLRAYAERSPSCNTYLVNNTSCRGDPKIGTSST